MKCLFSKYYTAAATLVGYCSIMIDMDYRPFFQKSGPHKVVDHGHHRMSGRARSWE